MPRLTVLLILCLLPILLTAQNPSGLITPPGTFVQDTAGETDIIKVFLDFTHIRFKRPPRVKGRKVYYSLLPIGTNVPGGGRALVTSTQAGFYLGPRRNTYLSTATFSPSLNFQGAFNLPIHSNIWSSGNKWNHQGDLRYSYFPQNTWGLGGKQRESDNVLINYSYIRLYFTRLRRIHPTLFAGIGYNLDYHIAIHPDRDSINVPAFTGYGYGTANHSNSFSSGITFNLLYDARVNSINPLPGFFYNIIYRVNPKFLGSDDWWHSLYADVRKYIPFSHKGQNVLAIWSYFWTTLGSPSPYLDLPALGWDAEQHSGRGFYNRRYTGRNLLYLESEYRRDLSRHGLFGFVVFANLNSVSEPRTQDFTYFHPAGGVGLRIKFNRNSATNIGIDFGFSKGYQGIYIQLGEVF